MFDEGQQRVRCLAHIINLACQDSLAILKTQISNGGAPEESQSESEKDAESGDDDDGMNHGDLSTFDRVSIS